MNYIKSYKVFENSGIKTQPKDAFLRSQLNHYGIKNFKINADGTVDVNGHVDISGRGIDKIPFKFGKVTGGFYCNSNNLSDLVGSPIEVGFEYNCSDNKIVSLKGCSIEVGDEFDCSNNKLTSLQGAPGEVGGHFDCSNNKLTHLDCSSNIKESLFCDGNKIDPKDPGFFGHVEGEIYFERP